MTTEQFSVGDATHIQVHGELDLATVPSLEGECSAAMRAGGGPVVLDLRRVDFMDSGGARLAVRLEARAQLHGIRFVMVRGPEAVERVFALTGMGRFVPAVDDPADL